jgi:hypothetical protein
MIQSYDMFLHRMSSIVDHELFLLNKSENRNEILIELIEDFKIRMEDIPCSQTWDKLHATDYQQYIAEAMNSNTEL